VDEAVGQGRAQAARRRQGVVERLGHRQGRALGQQGIQARPFQILHDEEMEPAILADEEDLRDVGVAQAGLGARLATKRSTISGSCATSRASTLMATGRSRDKVGAVVHRAHAAAAEQAHQGEVLQLRARKSVGNRTCFAG
jgi:hypothetical protein